MNDELLKAGLRAQQAGNAAEAARLYGAVLAANPRHFQALYLLAYLHLGAGSYDTADRLFEEAAKINPGVADVHFARGCALQQLNRHEAALATLSRALSLEPRNLGALVNRGVSLLELKRHDEALADFTKALAADPRQVEALVNRGVALIELDRFAEALADLDRALSLSPDHAIAGVNRANALRGAGRRDEAVAAYDKVLARDPRNIEALSNRGAVLVELKRYREALESFDRALALHPNYALAWFNRGNALAELKRFGEAVASYDKALLADPHNVDAMIGRANALAGERRFDDAVAGFGRALALDPNRADALGNRAAALFEQRRYVEAIADAERLAALDPERPYAKGLLLRSRLHCCDWRDLQPQLQAISAGIAAGKRVIQPFAHLSVSGSAEEQRACAEIHARNEYPPAPPLWKGEHYNHARLRLAYLSADFSAHATAHLMAGVFEHHDKSSFEIFAISFGRDDGSAMRGRLKRAFDSFLDVTAIGDADVATFLREKEIDVAVDLKGYTQEARPGILAYRPAPVQVNYLGYPGTMGAPYIDYIVADGIVIPPEHERFYSEAVVRLPGSYQCNDATRRIADGAPTRVGAGLPEQGFVFCCFNNSYKIMPEMFAVWMRLLNATQDSVLWLLDDNEAATRNLRREAEARGVEGNRLIFAAKLAPEDHLARHRLADLFLDTLPYGAHTTASDALWAGLPIVTCLGTSFAGRVAASLLTAVGLPELVTPSLAEYEALALRLTHEPAALSALKEKLTRNRTSAPLFDTARFTRGLEAAYTEMANRSRLNLKPAPIHVAAPIG